MPLTFTLFKSVTGNCTLPPTAVSTGGSVDQDVDNQRHKEEHVDEASLKPGTVWLIVLSER